MTALSSRALRAVATATAAAIGVAYALSPMSVWLALALGLLVRWAVRDLPARERRWVVAVVVAAAVLRVLLIAALFLYASRNPNEVAAFFGDEVYLKRRASWMANLLLGVDIPSHNFASVFDEYGRTGYHNLLAYLQILLGPIPYGVHLLNTALFLAAAVLLHRIVRTAFGRAPALAGLVLLLFWPTLFIWSVSALKESLLFFLSVLALVALVTALRAPWWRTRVAALGLAAAATAALWAARGEVVVMVVAGFSAALAVQLALLRKWLLVGVLMLTTAGVWSVTSRADVRGLVMQRLELAALLHRGHAMTTGHGYKLLDEHFYFDDPKAKLVLTEAEAARFAARALVAFMIVPLPWDVESASELAVVPQQAAWYLMLLLAVAGVVAGFRRDALLTLLLAGYIVVGTAGIALVSGNVGTLVRQRDKVVPFILCLGALGVTVGLVRLARFLGARGVRRDRHASPEPVREGARLRYGFPGVNLVDGTIGLAAIAILFLGWQAHRLARDHVSEITTVEPRRLSEGTSAVVEIHGQGLDSSLGVYLSGGRPVEGEFSPAAVAAREQSDARRVDLAAASMVRPEEATESMPGRDAFAERLGECVVRDEKYKDEGHLCRFVIESPARAELRVSNLEPGAYDVLLYDSTRVIARYASAVFVERARPEIALATITARFMMPQEVASLLQPGWRDRQSLGRPNLPASEADAPATLVSVERGRPVRVSRSVSLTNPASEELTVSDDVVPVDAVFKAFVRSAETGWENRGRTVKIGGPFSFESDLCFLRGWIVAIQWQ